MEHHVGPKLEVGEGRGLNEAGCAVMFSRAIAKRVLEYAPVSNAKAPVIHEFEDTLKNRELYGDRFIDDVVRERRMNEKKLGEARPAA